MLCVFFNFGLNIEESFSLDDSFFSNWLIDIDFLPVFATPKRLLFLITSLLLSQSSASVLYIIFKIGESS